MSQSNATALAQVLRWLSTHAQFPAQRLPEKTERAICFAHAATCREREAAAPARHFARPQNALESSHRARAENRRRAHFKCDNSAKV